MRCSPSPRRWSAKLALAVSLPALALLAGTPRAEAVSIHFTVTGPGGFSVSEADARATLLPIFERAPDPLNPDKLDIVTPAPVTIDTQATSTGPLDPAAGTTYWELTNRALDADNLWLVFYSHSADQVGLVIGGPNWAFFNPRSDPDYFYPALFLGDMPANGPDPTRVLIQYDQYDPGPFQLGTAGRANAPIPEPSSVLLFAAGVLGLAASRRFSPRELTAMPLARPRRIAQSSISTAD